MSNDTSNRRTSKTKSKKSSILSIDPITFQSNDNDIQSELSYNEDNEPSMNSSGEISAVSLMKGELTLDFLGSNDDSTEQDAQEEEQQEFDLHLPDFEQLMNQYSKPPPKPDNGSSVVKIPSTSMGTKAVANLSIGTPSVKSQYYHSTTSQFSDRGDDNEVLSMDGESEYESLFSDESFLSVSNEFHEKEEFQQPSMKITPPTPLIVEDDGYQTPTSQPSYNSSTRSLHSNNSRSLSSAASTFLNTTSVKGRARNSSSTWRHSHPTNHPNSTTYQQAGNNAIAQRNENAAVEPSSPLRRLSTHRRLSESINFLLDDPLTMTYSRRIALFMARRYKWYNPRLNNIYSNVDSTNDSSGDDDNHGIGRKKDVENLIRTNSENNRAPSIEVAWAYYEHMTLPRRLIREEESSKTVAKQPTSQQPAEIPGRSTSSLSSSGTRRMKSVVGVLKSSIQRRNRSLTVAVPGESHYKSKLYSPWTTPMSQMGDFGLGVGLYFGTMRAFTVLLFVAGIVNIPNMIFYGGKNYSNYQEGVEWWLKGSAACNDHTWVPCKDGCPENGVSMTSLEKAYRYQTVKNAGGQDMTFILKNECDGAIFRVGMVNFGTVLLLIVGMFFMAKYLRNKQVQFDLDEQTAQDYSIVIYNPPSDAYDPEEWKKYFKDNFPDCAGMHVTSVTIAVDNDELLAFLTKRRELIEKLKVALPDMNAEDVERVSELGPIVESILKESNFIQRSYANTLGVPAMYKNLVALNEKIETLSEKECPVTSVFVMFETEKAQRHVLEKLIVSKYSVRKNNVNALSDPKYLFRGALVLDVAEAEEPSTVRWMELNTTKKDLLVKFFTTCVVFGFIVLVAYIVQWCNEQNNDWAAIAIALFNVVFPQVAKLIAMLERHSREEHMQVWLYFKIAFFRWVNTAIVIWLITPYTSTTLPTEGGVLLLVYKIFLAEIVTTNILKWLDPAENFRKHFIAPRASTQENMNLHFRGSEVFLAERYTNLTKIVFLSVWYCSIYPAVLFFGAIALGVNYFFDRFAIMRTWKPQPKLGVSISHYTKYYVFPLTVIAMTFFANHMWAHFRFDRVCDTDKEIEPEHVGQSWEIPGRETIYKMDAVNITLSSSTTYHEFCSPDHTQDQTRIVSVFTVLSFINIGIVSLVFLVAAILIVKSYFYTKYEPVGDDQNIPMREVDSMTAYIPQIMSESFAYPLIACNIEKIKDSHMFEWQDQLRPYEYYDLTRDWRKILAERGHDGRTGTIEVNESKIFSKMVHWPYDAK